LPTDGPDPACDPPSWDDAIGDRGFQFYSPAICPDGFAVGASCTSVQVKTNEGFPSLASGETVAFCVPRFVQASSCLVPRDRACCELFADCAV
jgi:hypothetical protein